MHILLLSAYFPPDNGSAANLFLELGQAFVARQHRVSVVTGFPGYHAHDASAAYRGKLWHAESMDGMRVYRVQVPQVARNTPIGRGLWQFSCAASFALRGLRVPAADVVLLYSPPLPLGLSALVLRWLRNVPFVLNVQDLFPQSAIDLGLLPQRSLVRFFEALERFTYRRADAITAHSSGNRAHIIARGGPADRTIVVHNSVDLAHIRPAAAGPDGLPFGLQGKFIVSFAGVMGHSQDLDVILQAAHRLRDCPDMHFLLVGDGVDKARAMRQGEQLQLANLTWLPMVPREEYPAILHASSVGLATLRASVKTPVVPSKILSNMAAGLPVIAALDAHSDARSLLEQSQAGFWVEPEDSAALAERLRALYTDVSLRRRMGENGRLYAEEHFAVEKIAERYEQLFADVTTSHRSRG